MLSAASIFEEDGNGGVEQSLNDQLAGHAGEMLVTEDVQTARIRVPDGERSRSPARTFG